MCHLSYNTRCFDILLHRHTTPPRHGHCPGGFFFVWAGLISALVSFPEKERRHPAKSMPHCLGKVFPRRGLAGNPADTIILFGRAAFVIAALSHLREAKDAWRLGD